jgi:hypothetical protein
MDMQGRPVGAPMVIEAQAGLQKTWWQRPAGAAAGLYLVTWEWDGAVGAQRMVLH